MIGPVVTVSKPAALILVVVQQCGVATVEFILVEGQSIVATVRHTRLSVECDVCGIIIHDHSGGLCRGDPSSASDTCIFSVGTTGRGIYGASNWDGASNGTKCQETYVVPHQSH